MAALGGRLMAIARGVESGQTMADIGADHGFLPLYLWEMGICPKIIVTDISRESLNKAKNAFINHIGAPGVDFRLGDGLSPLECGEVDVIVIAGMGGALMVRMLAADMKKAASFSKYVMQPRNGAGKLRHWLDMAGFSIVSEELLAEGKFICEIITAKPPKMLSALQPQIINLEDIRYEMPRKLKNGSGELLARFVSNKLEIEKAILFEMIGGNYGGSDKIRIVESRIEFLEKQLEGEV